MTALERLLEVQAHDTRLDQIRHQRAVLPERAELADLDDQRAAAAERLDGIERRFQELAGQQERLEAEIAGLREKLHTADRTLYGGTVSNPRELQALQDEIEAHTRRISLLEDEELAVMEQLEPVEAERDEVVAGLVAIEDQETDVRERLAAAEADLDVEAGHELDHRHAAAEGVGDPELLKEYERIRERLQGVGVARLTAGTCGGCHLKLSAMEQDRIRREPPDAVVHCEECGRLLVR